MALQLSLLFVPLLSIILQQGSALECYSCDSLTTPSCGDPFTADDDDWRMNCGHSSQNQAISELLHEYFPGLRNADAGKGLLEGVCFKTVVTKRNKTSIFRSCSMFGDSSCELFTTALQADGGKMEFCETCTEELCNSSPGINIALSLLLSAPFMLLLKSF